MKSRGKTMGTGFAILSVVGIGVVLAATVVPTEIQQPRTQPQLENSSFNLNGSCNFADGTLGMRSEAEPPANCAEKEMYFDTTKMTWGYCQSDLNRRYPGIARPIQRNLDAKSTVRVLGANTLQAPGNIQLVDYTYLGERPHWYGAVPPRKPVWVDIPILTSQVIIESLLFVVSDSDWTFVICEDKNFGGCTFSVLRGSSFGWSGDYGYSAEPIPYVDRDGSNLIHVLVEGEDWFTFRALINYTDN